MSIATNVITAVLKSVVVDKFGSELTKEIIGISIDGISEKGINEITNFINSEKSQIEHILSRENMKSMGIQEENIDYVIAEIKNLFSWINITDEVLRQCKYDSMNLSVFLWDEYCKRKDGYVERESDIKRSLFIVAEALSGLVRKSNEFIEKMLIQISNSVDDISVRLQKISEYMENNSGKLDITYQSILEILKVMIEFSVPKDKGSSDNQVVKFKNNKKQDYIKNWNSRLFLHVDNDERPVTLADSFIIPGYILYKNGCELVYSMENGLPGIINRFIKFSKNSTLLIQGDPGIGKSSIIAWIAYKYKEDDEIIILRFRDWESEELQNGLLKAILFSLGCQKIDLENKILILDAFDEIKSVNNRSDLLFDFINDILDYNDLKVIITSRPSYLEMGKFKNVVNLLPFDLPRICDFYKIITGKKINGYKIKDTRVIGIPVILYMSIMSNIDIAEDVTKPELYSRIFAEMGGIFDKFSYDGLGYDGGAHPLRNIENIKEYLKFLREVAFEMFKKNKLSLKREDYNIPKLNFQGGYISVLEFPIKYLFETLESNIEFIHKSIFEFFVSEYIINSIYENINESEDYLASILGKMLSGSRLSNEIIEYLKYKFNTIRYLSDKYYTIYEIFQLMLKRGMMYNSKEYFSNIMDCEMKVFANMLDILHLWDEAKIELNDMLCKYINYNRADRLNLKSISVNTYSKKKIDLSGVYLPNADISNSLLQGVDLNNSNLQGAHILNSNLTDVNLTRANLSGTKFINTTLLRVNFQKAEMMESEFDEVDLRESDFNNVDLIDANWTKVILDEYQISHFEEIKCNLQEMKVYIKESGEIISYEKYLKRRIIKKIYNFVKKK